MTDLMRLPKRSGPGPDDRTDFVSLLAATTLTTDYVASSGVICAGYSTILLRIGYVKGSETNPFMQAEEAVSTDGTEAGTTWSPFGVIGASSSGTSDMDKHVGKFTPARWDADDSAVYEINCVGKQAVRFKFKYVGGSAPGTMACSVAGGKTAVSV